MRMRMNKVIAMVASFAAVIAMAACGGSGDSQQSASSYKTEPQEGTPTSYKGTLPMPEASKAYNNPQDRSKLKQGGTLTMPITEIGPDWNSFSANGNTTYMMGLWHLYMPFLWDYSVDGSTASPNKNYLTDVKLTSTDPETVTYTINDKAQWNDGTPITWKDFYSTWKVNNGQSSDLTPAITFGYENIKSVEKGSSDKQVVVTFENKVYPYQAIFQTLYPAQAYDENDDSKTADTFTKGWQNDPHSDKWGAGPYKVSKVSDSEVDFVSNSNWWGDKPLLDKIIVKQMEDSAMVNAFKNGEIDITEGDLSSDTLATVKTVKDAYIRRSYDSGVSTYTINTKAADTKDLAVRKAFVQAVDRSQITKMAFKGLDWNEKLPGSVILPQFQSGYEDNMPKDSGYSVANAKKTLEKAGYKMGSDGYYAKGGKTVQITYTTFSDNAGTKARAQAMQKMAKDAGIKVNIDINASNQFSTTVSSGNWDVIGLGWGATDPFGYSSSSYQLYGSDSDSNFGYIGSKSIDEKLKKVTATEDSKAAIKLFNDAEKEYMKNYAQIPISNGVLIYGVKKGLANMGPAGYSAESSRTGIPVHSENIGWEK